MNLNTSYASFWNEINVSNLLFLSNFEFFGLYWHNHAKHLSRFFGPDSIIIISFEKNLVLKKISLKDPFLHSRHKKGTLGWGCLICNFLSWIIQIKRGLSFKQSTVLVASLSLLQFVSSWFWNRYMEKYHMLLEVPIHTLANASGTAESFQLETMRSAAFW